jgi:hypothetical protein
MPARIPFEDLERMLGNLRSMAQEAGRDRHALALEVVAIPQITPSPLDSGRALFSGSLEQIKEDAARAKGLGATELIWQIELEEPIKSLLALMETLRPLAA